MAAQLPRTQIRRSSPVAAIERDADGRWRLTQAGGSQETFAGVIVALPADHAARCLLPAAPALAAELQSIPLASSVVVCFGVRRDQLRRPLNAFGCVVPAVEGRRILAISYSSLKFPERAPSDHVLLRVFLGGALQPELAERDDPELYEVARSEVAQLLGLRGRPELELIVRWPRAMPQYNVGHLAKVARIEQQLQSLPGLQLAGNALRGVGIPQCVHSGQTAAHQLVAQVDSRDSVRSPA